MPAPRGIQPGSSSAERTRLHPVIHAGDVLIVEEHTAVVEARLEAVALGPAAAGAIFRARLKIGGKVVRAVAVSAGPRGLCSGGGGAAMRAWLRFSLVLCASLAPAASWR